MADMAKRAGVGQVHAKIASAEDARRGHGYSASYFVTRWNVYINGKQIGYITRSVASPSSFYGYSTVDPTAMKGVVFSRIRDCIQWILQWDVGYAAAASMVKKATVESLEDEISMTDVVKGAGQPYLKKGEDGRDVLYIPHLASITPEQWEKISGIMRGMGYDSRGGVDASRAVQDMLRRAANAGREDRTLKHDDWVDTIAKVVGLKASSQKHSTKDRAATARKVFARAVKEWGLTEDPGLAGYILPNGTMLDLSGGSGTRAYDHRQVGGFLEPSEHGRGATDGMHEFMDLGAIRWMPEGSGVDIRVPPTKQQYARLEQIKGEVKGAMHLDVYSPNYGKAAREYGPSVPGQRVVNDIQAFYTTGQLGRMSQVQQFHGMGESIVAALLGEADDLLQAMGKVALNHTPSIAYRTWKTVYAQYVNDQDGKADEKAWEAVLSNLLPQSHAYATDAAANYLAIRGFDAQDELDPEEAWDEARAHTEWLLPLSPEAMRAIESLWRSIYVKQTMQTPMAEAEEQPELPFEEPPIDVSGITPEEIAVDSGVINQFKQIDGDWGDPWLYGGSWYSAYIDRTGDRWDSIYHVDGLEREGLSDYDSGSREVKNRLARDDEWKAKVESRRLELLQQYLLDQSNDDNPSTDPVTIAWCEREAKRDALSEVGDELAEKMNEEREIPVYRTNSEDLYRGMDQESIERDLRYVGLDFTQFEQMSAPARVCLYGEVHGWQEIDHQPISLSKAELEGRLKKSL